MALMRYDGVGEKTKVGALKQNYRPAMGVGGFYTPRFKAL